MQSANEVQTLDTVNYTVDEACQVLQISRFTLYKLINQQKIRSYKIGKKRMFRKEAVQEFQLEQERIACLWG